MRRLLPIVGLAAVLAAGACGGSSGAASGTTTTTIEPEAAMLAFARCMRDYGVDMPDPSTEGKGRFHIRAGSGQLNKEEFQEAEKACEKHLPKDGPLSHMDPEDREKLQDAMLAFARCMRSKGIDMPDPQFSGDGGGMIVKREAGSGGSGGSSPATRFPEDDPAFEAAERECRKTTLEPVEKELDLNPPERSFEGRGG